MMVLVAHTLLMVALLLGVVRLLRGPTLADRIIALDILYAAAVAWGALVALDTGRVLYFDVALGIALTGFIATLAWARLAERLDDGEDRQ